MTIHYHGTPITPMTALYQLAGSSFCVSYARPDQVKQCHDIGEQVLLDNGAFSAWTAGRTADWPGYYKWSDKWLNYRSTLAVIPDVIDGGEEMQDGLILQWPHGTRGAPVWHMDETVGRLLRLIDQWPVVCIGSTKEYKTVLSEQWCVRMDGIWDAIISTYGRVPDIHMLRGMQCVGRRWPFTRVDSTDIGRNHARPNNVAWEMAGRWNAIQCSPTWKIQRHRMPWEI